MKAKRDFIEYDIGPGYAEVSADRTGRRMIEGTASTAAIDCKGGGLDPLGCCLARFPIPLLFDHRAASRRTDFPLSAQFATDEDIDHGRVGEVIWLRKTSESVRIRAVIDDSPGGDLAWEQISSGAMKMLSVMAVGHVDPRVSAVEIVNEWLLREVSLCKASANPECTFHICEVAV